MEQPVAHETQAQLVVPARRTMPPTATRKSMPLSRNHTRPKIIQAIRTLQPFVTRRPDLAS